MSRRYQRRERRNPLTKMAGDSMGSIVSRCSYAAVAGRWVAVSREAGGARTRWIHQMEQLDRLAEAWRGLGRGLPMTQFAWCRAAAESFSTDKSRRMVVVNRRGRMVGAAPLVAERMGGIVHGSLLGVRELHEPMDLVYRDEAALEELVGELLSWGAPLFLERVLAESPTVKAFGRVGRRAVVVKRPHPGCPHIALDETWGEPEGKLNSGRRSDLRRAMRQAQRRGPVTWEILKPRVEELPRLWETAVGVEAASWKGTCGTALLHDRERCAFFRRYVEAACGEGMLRLCFLRIGEQVAAMQIAVECSKAFWLLKVGYDPAFASCSPGNLLLCETIRHAARSGLESYEFLGSISDWTRMWTQQERACVSLRVYPVGVRGMAALAVRAGVWGVGRGKEMGRWGRGEGAGSEVPAAQGVKRET